VLTVNVNMVPLADIGKSMAASAGTPTAAPGVNDNVAA
jgi:hypothetical protein